MAVDNKVRKAAQGDFKERVLIAMHRKRTNVSKLARKLKISRMAVSLAINHGIYEGTLDKVRKELGL